MEILKSVLSCSSINNNKLENHVRECNNITILEDVVVTNSQKTALEVDPLTFHEEDLREQNNDKSQSVINETVNNDILDFYFEEKNNSPEADDCTKQLLYECLEAELKNDTVTTVDEHTYCKEETFINKNKEVEKEHLGGEGEQQLNSSESEDFDPTLLCPEISVDVDESTVVNPGPELEDSVSANEQKQICYQDRVTGEKIIFDLTETELKAHKDLYKNAYYVRTRKIHCTACQVHLGSALVNQTNRYVHPLLKVIMCKSCYDFYMSGEFTKDEDGSELYCRWCGQGGNVMCCSKCSYVFCKKCIKSNLGHKKFLSVRDSDEWLCCVCDSTQISAHRIACYELFQYVEREFHRGVYKNTDLFSKDFNTCCTAKKDLPVKPNNEDGMPIDLNNGIMEQQTKPRKSKIFKDVWAPAQSLPKFSQNLSVQFNQSFINPSAMPRQQSQAPVVALRTTPFVRPMTNVLNFSAQPTLYHVMHPQGSIPLKVSPMMNNEWFQKTVVGTAKINSQLSYALTQLNVAERQAITVEQMADIHNRLQELLSSSINSLIHIRRNLRNDFLNNLKPFNNTNVIPNPNYHIPSPLSPSPLSPSPLSPSPLSPSPLSPSPLSPSQVSAAPSVVKDAILVNLLNGQNQMNINNNNNKINNHMSTTTTTTATNQTYVFNKNTINKPRIAVRTITELQKLTSDCIIVHNDDEVMVNNNNNNNKTSPIKTEINLEESVTKNLPIINNKQLENDKAKNIENTIIENNETKNDSIVNLENKENNDGNNIKKRKNSEIINRAKKRDFCYNINEKPTPEVKRMCSVKVILRKQPEIDKMIMKY